MKDIAVITKQTVRENPAQRAAQKASRKAAGLRFAFGAKPRARIDKVVSLSPEFVSAAEKRCIEVPKVSDAAALTALLQRENLVGLSGSGYPAAEKIAAFAASDAAEKHILFNAVECEPGLVHDRYVAAHAMPELAAAAKTLCALFGVGEVQLASMQKLTQTAPQLVPVCVPDRYPMGYENELIRRVYGVALGKVCRPAGQGILVMNVQTAAALGALLLRGEEPTGHCLTAADLATGRSAVIYAAAGTDVRSLLQKALPGASGTPFVGGGAMSCHPAEAGETIGAATSFIGYGTAPDYAAAQKCMHCGACAAHCPMHIRTNKIVAALENGDTAAVAGFSPESCIRCGACTYFCEAGKDIRGLIADWNEQHAAMPVQK